LPPKEDLRVAQLTNGGRSMLLPGVAKAEVTLDALWSPPDVVGADAERFGDLLDEMTRSTDMRFIITRNPITMARMNRRYGVAMAQRSVSQLVSMELERRGEAARSELGRIHLSQEQ
jgi:hypothetical protein